MMTMTLSLTRRLSPFARHVHRLVLSVCVSSGAAAAAVE